MIVSVFGLTRINIWVMFRFINSTSQPKPIILSTRHDYHPSQCHDKHSFENSWYLPDIKTASYFPRPAEIMRCFNLFKDGSTSNAGGSVVIPNMK
ncbi:hypothetical protein Hanom_Chr14g01261961 [Helianthus anomalus]